jgi:hypothetical protein
LLANVLLPALMFLPPAIAAVLLCEIVVYWLFLRRQHRLWRVVRIVVIVNLISTLFGWFVYPAATAIPSPNPMAVVKIPSNESPEERGTARRAITLHCVVACGLSIVIEGLALLVFGREFPWRRLAIPLVASNVLSYLVMWIIFLAVTGRSFFD